MFAENQPSWWNGEERKKFDDKSTWCKKKIKRKSFQLPQNSLGQDICNQNLVVLANKKEEFL